MHRIVAERLGFHGVVEGDCLGWLFVGVRTEQLLDLLEDGVELFALLLVLCVVGTGGNVAAEFFQIVKRQHDWLFGRRTLDGVLEFGGQEGETFEQQRTLSLRQFEANPVVGLNMLLAHFVFHFPLPIHSSAIRSNGRVTLRAEDRPDPASEYPERPAVRSGHRPCRP